MLSHSILVRSFIQSFNHSYLLVRTDRFKDTLYMPNPNLKYMSFYYNQEGSVHPFSESHPQCEGIREVLEVLALERSVKLRLTIDLTMTPIFPLHHLPITSLELEMVASLHLRPDQYPSTLTDMSLSNNQPFSGTLNDMLPNSLKTLDLNNFHSWNQQIKPGSLPNKLESIEFNKRFNQVIQLRTFPDTLTRLRLGDSFDQPLNGVLPPSLTCLTFGRLTYEHDLFDLPASLTTIYLPGFFKRRLEHAPLQRLHIYDDKMPRGGHSFPNLRKLWMKAWVSNMDWALFPAIIRLTIDGSKSPDIDISTLPWTKLKNCKLFCEYGYVKWPLQFASPIPFGVEKLALGNLNFPKIALGVLPPSITRLALWNPVSIRHGHIPSSVTSLQIHNCDLEFDPRVVPPSVRDLTLTDVHVSDNLPIIKRVPITVMSLTITSNWSSFILRRISDQYFFRSPSLNVNGY
ncbi:hypothetical protein SAMD00019534_049320, partial [Acytostelium subglobosum LB1]|uniref:hypothetical protein n=1 Tax=Acytostelium subglobosum LB1 TaxID=1410327 RepID=UPI000644B7D2